MRFLLLSGRGRGCALLMRLRDEGYQVGVWIRHGRFRRNWENLIPRIQQWEKFLQKDSVVVEDSPGGGSTAERLRSRGYRVIGGSALGDQLEADPVFQREMVEATGLKLPEEGEVTYWFDGENFGPTSFCSLRVRRFMAGDLGPEIECAGVKCWSEERLHNMEAFRSLLTQHSFIGCVTLSSKGISLFFPYDTLSCILSMCESAFAFLSGNWPCIRQARNAVRISVSPYPSPNERAPIGLSLKGWEKEDRPWIYPYDVKLTEEGQLVTSGGEGLIASVVGDSWENAYARVRRLSLPDVQYRTDLKEVYATQENLQPGGSPVSDLLRNGSGGEDLSTVRAEGVGDIAERQSSESAGQPT